MKRTGIAFGLLAAVVAALGFARAPTDDSVPDRANSDPGPRAAAEDTATQVAMRNVNFFVIPSAALRIRTMRGEMRSLTGGPVVFDDKNSFVIDLDYAEIGLNGTDI